MTIEKHSQVADTDPQRRLVRVLLKGRPPATTGRGRADDATVEETARHSGAEVIPKFGARLREARLNEGPEITQQAVGDLLGFQRGTVTKWEDQAHYPRTLSETKCRLLSEYLGVRYEWLRHGTGQMFAGKTAEATPTAGESVTSPEEIKSMLEGVRGAKRTLEDIERRLEDIKDRN